MLFSWLNTVILCIKRWKHFDFFCCYYIKTIIFLHKFKSRTIFNEIIDLELSKFPYCRITRKFETQNQYENIISKIVKGKIGNILFEESNEFINNKFFPDAKLNYAANLLAKNNLEPSIIFKSENGYKKSLSWKDLNLQVAQISSWLKVNGVKKGDRIAAYLPNIPETVSAYLSSSAIGAIWSSCSPDFGTLGVIDRFSQINPKILFVKIRN